MSDLEQQRRRVRVLGLLNDAYRAHRGGDSKTAGTRHAEANAVDPGAVAGVYAGMAIGEIPDTEHQWTEWAAYVRAARDELARAEEEAGADG